MRRLDPIPFALIGAYVILAVLFCVRVPYGTPPDEAPHVAYVQYLSEHHRLPTLGESDLATTYEYHQPPLYYSMLLAIRSASGGQAGADVEPDASKPPPRPIIALRLFGVFLTAIAIAMIYTSMRRISFAKATAAAVAGMYGLVPMNLYMSAAVNNDVLASFLNVSVLLALARGTVNGFSARGAVGVGILVGFGVWTKTSCLLLIPGFYLAAYLGLRLVRDKTRAAGPGVLGLSLWFTLAVLLVASPWLARNSFVYGDPLAAGAYHEAFSQTNVSPQYLLEKLGMPPVEYARMWARYTFTSFWGLFGHTDVPLPASVYYALLGFCLVSLAGLVFRGLTRRPSAPREKTYIAWLYAACLLIAFAAFVRFNFDYFQAQARYLGLGLFPAFFLLATGWLGFFGRNLRQAAALLLVICLIALDLYALFGVIIPRYGV